MLSFAGLRVDAMPALEHQSLLLDVSQDNPVMKVLGCILGARVALHLWATQG